MESTQDTRLQAPSHGVEDEREREIRRCTDLLHACARGGSRSQFDEMARLARPFLMRKAAYEVGRIAPHLDPEEVVQETLLNLFKYGKGFQPEVPYAFSTWVGRILRNVVLRMLKRRRRQPYVSFEDLEGLEFSECEAKGPMRSLLDDEERGLLRRDFATLLGLWQGSFEKLTDLQKRVLERVAMHGESYREIAEDLGMRVEAVKMVAFRARRRMNTQMERLAS